MTVLFILMILCLILPATTYGRALKRLRELSQENDPLHKGQQLYSWIDSFGPERVSFNLSQALPEKGSYLPFSRVLHELWQSVQIRGGQLSELLNPLKLLLREDLKRFRRQREVLRGACFQLGLMVAMVWTYLGLYSYLMEVSFSKGFSLIIIVHQVGGVVLFWWAIRYLKSKHFSPFESSLDLLLQLTSIAQRGDLGSACLVASSQKKQSSDHKNFQLRLDEVLALWQQQGFAKTASLNPLREDLMLLASDSTQLFLENLKVLTFLWAIVFVLPPLFAGSLFGLYKLAVV